MVLTAFIAQLIAAKSWHQFNTGLVNTNVQQLVVLNGLFTRTQKVDSVYSIDGGESWIPSSSDTSNLTHIEEFNGELYASKGTSRFLRLTSEGNIFTDIPGGHVLKNVPDLPKSLSNKWIELSENKTHKTQFLIEPRPKSLTVTDTTYYVEYQNELFRWRIGTLNWYNTGIADVGGPIHIDSNSKFVIANEFIGLPFQEKPFTSAIGMDASCNRWMKATLGTILRQICRFLLNVSMQLLS